MNDKELDAILESWETPEPTPALREGVRHGLPPAPRKRPYGWLAAAASLVATASLLGVAMLGNGQARLADGTYIRSSLEIRPRAAADRWRNLGHGLATGGNHQQGVYYNPADHTYTGYDLTVEPKGSGTFLLTVQPLSKPFSQLAGDADAAQYRELPLPSPIEARVVKGGEAFDIDLIRDAQTGDRVFERIELSDSSFGGFSHVLQAHHAAFIHWIHGLLGL